MYKFYAEVIKNGVLSGHNRAENEDFKFELPEGITVLLRLLRI